MNRLTCDESLAKSSVLQLGRPKTLVYRKNTKAQQLPAGKIRKEREKLDFLCKA